MTTAPTEFQSPYGVFNIIRYPARADDTLVAWCSADILLLEELKRLNASGSIVVINDTHGALCVALQPQGLWTDSALAALALRSNERSNARIQTPVFWSTQTPTVTPDFVVMRIPKQRNFFEYQLSVAARWLRPGTTLLAAGMDKHLSPHTANILERYIGKTERLPGRRKARLFRAVKEDRAIADYSPAATYQCPGLNTELQGFPNVFSREKLDIGSRFLLEHLHELEPVETAIDLACGNGVLGLSAFRQGLAQRLLFCDESAMAIASAQSNANSVFPQSADNFHFHHGDGLDTYSGDAAQLILCNPPFHQEHTVNEFAGHHLLAQCARHLRSDGCLFLVANRHLDYLSLLRKTFYKVEKFASNPKFNLIKACKE